MRKVLIIISFWASLSIAHSMCLLRQERVTTTGVFAAIVEHIEEGRSIHASNLIIELNLLRRDGETWARQYKISSLYPDRILQDGDLILLAEPSWDKEFLALASEPGSIVNLTMREGSDFVCRTPPVEWKMPPPSPRARPLREFEARDNLNSFTSLVASIPSSGLAALTASNMRADMLLLLEQCALGDDDLAYLSRLALLRYRFILLVKKCEYERLSPAQVETLPEALAVAELIERVRPVSIYGQQESLLYKSHLQLLKGNSVEWRTIIGELAISRPASWVTVEAERLASLQPLR